MMARCSACLLSASPRLLHLSRCRNKVLLPNVVMVFEPGASLWRCSHDWARWRVAQMQSSSGVNVEGGLMVKSFRSLLALSPGRTQPLLPTLSGGRPHGTKLIVGLKIDGCGIGARHWQSNRETRLLVHIQYNKQQWQCGTQAGPRLFVCESFEPKE